MSNTSTHTVIEQLRARAAANPKTIYLPESEDDRTLEAASLLYGRGLVKVGLVGDPKKIAMRVEKGGWASMPGSKDTNYSGLAQACATALRDLK